MTVSTDPRKTGVYSIPMYAWASKPDASTVPSGTVIRATDVGIAPGARFVSDGAVWRPDGPVVLSRTAVAVSAPADTNENTLASVSVPAGAMGLNGSLRIVTTWATTNSANNKTLRVKLGTNSFLTNVITTSAGVQAMTLISNTNSASAQVGFANSSQGFGTTTGTTPFPGTTDTGSDATLLITGQKASSGETLTLVRYVVELLP